MRLPTHRTFVVIGGTVYSTSCDTDESLQHGCAPEMGLVEADTPEQRPSGPQTVCRRCSVVVGEEYW